MRNGIVIDKVQVPLGLVAIIYESRPNVTSDAIYQLTGGDEVTYTLPDGTEDTLTATQDIPLFHKIARTDIAAGERVVKYGEYIGVATCDIKRGEHVHSHNCVSDDETKDAEGAEENA